MVDLSKEVIDFRKGFEKSISDIQKSIMNDVRDIVGENKCEIERIQSIYLNVIFDAALKHHETGADIDDCLMDAIDNTNSEDIPFAELVLSVAIYHSVLCAYHYFNAQMNYAIADLINANYYLGTYRGYTSSEIDFQQQRHKIIKKAADIRHKENREMKSQAIQYYKENYKDFSNKDDAAMEIAKKVVPAKFSTVRGWLKGIKPESS